MNTPESLVQTIVRLAVMLPALLSTSAFSVPPPDILIIMADDCTYNDLPLYGGQNAKTPNIDALAAEGLTFDRAYLCSAMCQPCRAELFTGQYPMRNGCAWNHSASRKDTRSLPHYLKPLGYRVGIAGKVHVKPPRAFPFEKVPGFDASCVRNPTQAHDMGGVRSFLNREGRFCLVVALVEPHVPWVMGDASKYPPESIRLPANIADTPRTRQDFARYLAEITYMDSQVGDILQALEESGRADSTLVLFTSEQGSQFPGCKWTNWDTGVHTALIARWPGVTPSGRRTSALVQYCDVVPTLLDIAGASPQPSLFDGVSFRSVLEGAQRSHRRYAFGMHNNVPEGPAYPVRSVTDGTYRYIRNLTSDRLFIEKHLMGVKGDGGLNNPYWGTWMWNSQEDEATYGLIQRYMRRPADEFYNTSRDPFELHNLAGDSNHAARQQQLAQALDNWMQDQGDPGAAQDTLKALNAARKGEHLYGP